MAATPIGSGRRSNGVEKTPSVSVRWTWRVPWTIRTIGEVRTMIFATVLGLLALFCFVPASC